MTIMPPRGSAPARQPPSQPSAPNDAAATAPPPKTMGRRHALAATVVSAAAGAVAGRHLAQKADPTARALEAYNCTGAFTCSGDETLRLSPAAAMARRIVNHGDAMDLHRDLQAGLAAVIGGGGLVGATLNIVLEQRAPRRGVLGAIVGFASAMGTMFGMGSPAERQYTRDVYNTKVRPARDALAQQGDTELLRAADERYFKPGFDQRSAEGRALRDALREGYETRAVGMRLTDPHMTEPNERLRKAFEAATRSIEDR